MTTQFPDDFKCPISLEVMSDPVILSSGHTFDRSSIQRWLDAGHRTCPITKLPLPDRPSLIPNHALRSLISNFAPPVSATSEPDNVIAASFNLQGLVSVLTSKSSSLESKLDSVKQLYCLSKRDSSLRRRITESGAVSAVLKCLRYENSQSGSLVLVLQEKALSMLLNLSLEDDNKVGLVAEGVIGRVVTALRVGSSDCRAIAATLITSLAVVEVNKATIGDYPLAIQSLVLLLQTGKRIREKKEAATALYALSSFPDNRRRLVSCGAVPILLQVADSGLERAVEVLSMVSKCKEGREEMMKYDGCVRVFTNTLKNNSSSSRAIQGALFSLNLLCSCSEKACLETQEERILDLCFEFAGNENEKIKINAANLIKRLSGVSFRVEM